MEEEGPVTCGTPLDHFAESKELSSIVSTLPNVCGELRPSENTIEKFTGTLLQLRYTFCISTPCGYIVPFMSDCNFFAEILDKYQEQPHLLDPYLGKSVL